MKQKTNDVSVRFQKIKDSYKGGFHIWEYATIIVLRLVYCTFILRMSFKKHFRIASRWIKEMSFAQVPMSAYHKNIFRTLGCTLCFK